MKTFLLSLLALSFITFSGISQEEQECSANVTALQDQIKKLANLLGDDSVIEQIETAQEEDAFEAKLEEIERKKITLSEKDPNPYETEDELALNIPESAKTVELVFSNNLGQEIKRVNIAERGESSLTVYMSEYMIGNYSYQLYVDGVAQES